MTRPRTNRGRVPACANDTAGGKHGKASQNQRFAAEAVGERTDRKLPEGERNEKAAQQETEFRRGNLKLGANPRKRREDDVGGERAERSQTGKQEQNPSSHTALGRRGHHGFLPGPRNCKDYAARFGR